jgi:hypothetical protein
MSFLVALAGSRSALIATDSRRIENNVGTVRDDFSKVFRLSGVLVIGGHTGLVEFSGRTVPAWFQTLPISSWCSMDSLVREAKAFFEEQMTNIAEEEVGFQYRCVDIVLVGFADLKKRKGPVIIRAIVLRPDSFGKRVTAEIRKFTGGFCMAGDDAAMKAVDRQIRALRPSPQCLPEKRLETVARNLVNIGVKKAGCSPTYPTLSSCGGPTNLMLL